MAAHPSNMALASKLRALADEIEVEDDRVAGLTIDIERRQGKLGFAWTKRPPSWNPPPRAELN